MALFFIHVRDLDGLIEDPEGSEFPDLENAYAEAWASAREILANELRAGKTVHTQQLEICDAAGRMLATVPLRDAFTLSSQG